MKRYTRAQIYRGRTYTIDAEIRYTDTGTEYYYHLAVENKNGYNCLVLHHENTPCEVSKLVELTHEHIDFLIDRLTIHEKELIDAGFVLTKDER